MRQHEFELVLRFVGINPRQLQTCNDDNEVDVNPLMFVKAEQLRNAIQYAYDMGYTDGQQ